MKYALCVTISKETTLTQAEDLVFRVSGMYDGTFEYKGLKDSLTDLKGNFFDTFEVHLAFNGNTTEKVRKYLGSSFYGGNLIFDKEYGTKVVEDRVVQLAKESGADKIWLINP